MMKRLISSTLGVLIGVTTAVAENAPMDATITAPLGNAITYQGRLKKNGTLVNGNCNLIFKLFDQVAGGLQINNTVTLSNQPVTEGLFVGTLAFTAGSFNGQARWLEIQVQGPGDVGFTLLDPRQPINAAPYALYSLNSTGNPWVVGTDGQDLTYSAGGVAITGASSPFGAGRGVYIEGYDTRGLMFAYNYGTSTPLDLILNSPGGRVSVGSTTPEGRLFATTSANEPAVYGKNTSNSIGVSGQSQSHNGVQGTSTSGNGVFGLSNTWFGVYGKSTTASGVLGETSGTANAGVTGISLTANGWGGYFKNNGGGLALVADGTAQVKSLTILGGADLAERFEAAEPADPGTVMMIDTAAAGRMRIADEAYCKRVAGVVSGAGSLQAGVTLGVEATTDKDLPIALTGRVWVKSDATQNAIRPGDLLTTSNIPGHAMAVTDAARATGAILGKAMSSLETGTGMVLVLVSLQ